MSDPVPSTYPAPTSTNADAQPALACPSCLAALVREEEALVCPVENRRFHRRQGVWDLRLSDPAGGNDAALDDADLRPAPHPAHPTTGAAAPREAHFLHLLGAEPARDIVLLGAEGGRLPDALLRRLHRVTHVLTGEGPPPETTKAPAGFPTYLPVRADLAHLPFDHASTDLIFYDASSRDHEAVVQHLREALRILRPCGRIILASDAAAAPPGGGYATTVERLNALSQGLGLEWTSGATGSRRAAGRLLRLPLRALPQEGPELCVGRRTVPPAPTLAQRVLAPAARRVLRLRYQLFQRHRHGRLAVERVDGLPIIVLPGVFNPVLFRSGLFMFRTIQRLPITESWRVLDLGTGSGLGALGAAFHGAEVDAVDVNPAAVRCAALNALLHERSGYMRVLEGDLFAPVEGRRYDAVFFNPPYFRGTPADDPDRAWRGESVVERFAAGLPAHLAPRGAAYVALSSDGDAAGFLHAFHAAGLTVRKHALRRFLNETLTIYRLTPAW